MGAVAPNTNKSSKTIPGYYSQMTDNQVIHYLFIQNIRLITRTMLVELFLHVHTELHSAVSKS